jgi:chromosome segregation ATPase
LTGPTPRGRPLGSSGSSSLDDIEQELAVVERKLAALRDAASRSQGQSAADAAALRQMGIRVKEIMNRPKSWRGDLKRSDAAELEALRAEMRSREEATSRTVEGIKSMSAEARDLGKRQQDLSRLRAELIARRVDT